MKETSEKVLPLEQRPKRNASFELLRILSMLMIVSWHLCGHGGFLANSTGASHIIFEIINLICLIAVNLFIMITSYFMVSKQISLKKLVRLWVEVIFYSAGIYFILLAIGVIPFNARDLLVLIPVSSQRYWFVTAYFIFYLLLPLLNIIVEKLNQKQHLLLCLFLMFLTIIEKTLGTSVVEINDGYSVIWFLMIFIFISYYKKHLSHQNNLHIIIFVLGFIVSVALAYFSGYYYSNPLVFFAGLCLLIIFERIRITNARLSAIITFISSTTFGVYLIHESSLSRVLYSKILCTSHFYASPYAVPIMIGFCFAIFVAGLIIDFLRQNLFKAFIWVYKNIKNKKLIYK